MQKSPSLSAGIMGGANSEIKDSTTNVFIESAYFDPALTRRLSKALGLLTDSSYRFERGVDIEKTEWASKRAADLMASLAGGKIVSGFLDNYPKKKEKLSVRLRNSYLNRITGIEFTLAETKDLLEGIGIKCFKEESDNQVYQIPSFRAEDLLREADLVEEALRLNGYEKIKDSEYFNIYLDVREFSNPDFDALNEIRDYFSSRGYYETITNSLLSEKEVALFGYEPVRLLSPSNKLMSVLRTSLIPGALSVVRHNFNRNVNSLKLFEIGDIFRIVEPEKPEESNILEVKGKILVMAGFNEISGLGEKDRYFDVFDMKGEVEMLFEKMNIENYILNDYYYDSFYKSKFDYVYKNKILASVIELSHEVLSDFEIEKPVIICEIY